MDWIKILAQWYDAAKKKFKNMFWFMDKKENSNPWELYRKAKKTGWEATKW